MIVAYQILRRIFLLIPSKILLCKLMGGDQSEQICDLNLGVDFLSKKVGKALKILNLLGFLEKIKDWIYINSENIREVL